VSPIGKGLDAYIHRQVTEIALNQLAEAREQAARIQEQAKNELEQKRAQFARESEQEANKERQRTLSQARLEQQRQSIEVREQFVGKVWQQVEDELRSIAASSPEIRLSVLEALITDAAEQLQGGDLELQVGAHDLALIKPELPAIEHNLDASLGTTLHLNPVPADIWGGVLVTRTNSNLVVDNSFATRLELAQTVMRNQVLRILES